MSELAVHQPQPLPAPAHLVQWAQEADAAHSLAQRLCSSAFAPAAFRGKPIEGAAAILAGAEVGLSPLASLRAFDVIQGVAAPRALTIRAIVQSHGHEMHVTESSPTKVVMRGRRKGEDTWQEAVWTIDRAQALGLTSKQQWKSQPETMLTARATTDLGRRIAADALLGIGLSVEEVRDSDQTRPVQTPATPTADAFRPRTDTAEAPGTVDAEVLEPDPAPTITPTQLKALQASLRDAGITNRDDALALYKDVTGRDVDSSKHLTRDEASDVIDRLKTTPAPVADPDADFAEPPADHWAQQETNQ